MQHIGHSVTLFLDLVWAPQLGFKLIVSLTVMFNVFALGRNTCLQLPSAMLKTIFSYKQLVESLT